MKRLRQSLDVIDTFETTHPYVSAVAAGALHFAAGNAITHLGDKAGVSLRHGRSKSAVRTAVFEHHPVLSAVGLSVAVPVAEEIFWREAPARIAERFPDQPNIQRAIKLGVVALFALQHAGKDGVPVNQAIGGVLYQHLHDKNGVGASILAHTTNNTLAVGQHILKNYRSRE